MSYVVTVRLPNKEIWERAKQYAKREGMIIGMIVVKALELYINREDKMLYELKEIKEELDRLRDYLEGLKVEPKGYRADKLVVKIKAEDYNLPSFVRDNPWVEVLEKRREE